MSRIEARRWLILAVTAFLLRAGVAAVTEFKPLFPAYYYQDAAFAEELARGMSRAWREGRVHSAAYAQSQRAHAALIALPFLAFGERPFAAKLINCALGAASVVLLGLALRTAFAPDAALAAAALAAAWPSHAFYTSQNFKEAPAFVLLYGGLALLLSALAAEKPAPARAAAGALCLAAAGLLRGYTTTVASAALAAGALWALRRPRARAAAAVVLAAASLAVPLRHALSRHAFEPIAPVSPGVPSELPPMAPIAVNGEVPPPWTPAGLSYRRAQRQASDRAYAVKSSSRDIGSQIHPDARFETWPQLLDFLPKAAFTVLFQPLPGLYPLEGKRGRLFAALENLLLLALAAAAALGLARRREWTPPLVALGALFVAMTAGSAVMEFDLGSAGRHKLFYLPLIFPLAAETLLRAAGRRA